MPCSPTLHSPDLLPTPTPEQGWESQGHGVQTPGCGSGSVLDSCALMRAGPESTGGAEGKPSPVAHTHVGLVLETSASRPGPVLTLIP